MKRPNFFIAGAPKCGTTALCEYLRHHPAVFFSDPKEPHYFAEDFDAHRMVRDLASYEALFADANAEHQRVGEGSVLYLYSAVAFERIRAFNPEARIIVMLRNPMEMIPSQHQQYLGSLYEDEPSLEQAWALQDERAAGRYIPRLCRQPELLAYKKIGRFGEQLERLWQIFPREQTMVIVFDDFVADTRKVYLQVLAFLGLEDDGRTDFPRINEASGLRGGLPSWIARHTPVSLRNLLTHLRFTRSGRGIPKLADRLFKRSQPRQRISPAFHAELKAAFADDISHLSALIGRDLSAWMRIESDGENGPS